MSLLRIKQNTAKAIEYAKAALLILAGAACNIQTPSGQERLVAVVPETPPVVTVEPTLTPLEAEECIDTYQGFIHPFTMIHQNGYFVFKSIMSPTPEQISDWLTNMGYTTQISYDDRQPLNVDFTIIPNDNQLNLSFRFAYAEFYGPDETDLERLSGAGGRHLIIPSEELAMPLHNHAQCSNRDEWQGITPLY
jgi:hypothetical protein